MGNDTLSTISQVKNFFKALRPLSFLLPLSTCLFGISVAYYHGSFDPINAAVVGCSVCFLQAGINLINYFFMYRTRPVAAEGGTVHTFGAGRSRLDWIIFLAGVSCLAFLIPFGLFLLYRTGLPFFLFAGIGVCGVFFFAAEPCAYRKKSRLAPAFFFAAAVIAVFISYYVTAAALNLIVFLLALPQAFFITGLEISTEVRDVSAGVFSDGKTFTGRTGLQEGRVLILLLLCCGYLTLLMLTVLYLPWLYPVLSVSVVLIPALIYASRHRYKRLFFLHMLHYALFSFAYCLLFFINAD
jgi:1,4-dihydroxy-2-naphthoate octaprenyltransferase